MPLWRAVVWSRYTTGLVDDVLPFVFHETAEVLSEKVKVERWETVNSALARTSSCAIEPESSRLDWILGGNQAYQRIGFLSLEAIGC